MGPFVIFDILVWVALLGVGGYGTLRLTAMRRALRRAASRLGLNEVPLPGQLRDATGLVGKVDGFRVTIMPRGESGANQETTITVDTFGGKGGRIPHALELRRKTGNVIDRLGRGQDLLTGDEDFDRQILVRGHPDFVHAVLNAETRQALLPELLSNRTRVEGGSVIRNVVGLPKTTSVLEDAAHEVLGLAKRLSVEQRDVPALLAAQALGDPLPAVRRTALDTLLQHFGDYPRATETARAARADRSRAVRLRAAVFLGEEGQSTLKEIAERPDIDDPLAAQAFRHLAEAWPAQRVVDLIDAIVPRARADSKLAAIEALTRIGGEAAATRLTLLLGDGEATVAAAAAGALGQQGDASAEPALIRALESGPDDVSTAAAEALGFVGSKTAVPPLRTAAESSASSAQLRTAARSAVAKIQARIVGGAPGQISLAQDERAEGRVSLAPPEPAGQLSLPERPHPRGAGDSGGPSGP